MGISKTHIERLLVILVGPYENINNTYHHMFIGRIANLWIFLLGNSLSKNRDFL